MGTVTQWIVAAMVALTVLFLLRRINARRAVKKRIQAEGPSQIVIHWDHGPPGQIAVQDWMTAPEPRAVMSAITADGDEARFVGGCVRDAVLKLPIRDIDIATTAKPDKVASLLEKAGLKAVPTGIEHGTVTAIANHKPFEITTLRRDVATDGRRATVEFTDNWREDAARRDFTVNALSLTPDGMIYDYFNGLQDIADRVIRFVGPPRQRIAEDYLRILRFFRFIAVYRMRVPGKEALDACQAAARNLTYLSGERIRKEMFRILAAEHAAEALNLMKGAHVLDEILPESAGLERLRKLIWLETRAMGEEKQYIDPLRRLAALLVPDGADGDAIADRLKLSNVERKRLKAMIDQEWRPSFDTTNEELRQQLRRIPPETMLDLALLAWADALSRSSRVPPEESSAWQRIVEAAESWLPDKFPLRGRDVLALGIPEGPRVKELLLAVEAWWEDGGFAADRASCLARLRAEIDGTL